MYRLRRRAAESAPPSTPSRRKPARSSLAEHDPIVISLENTSTLALSRGFVLGLEADSVVVGLDRSLSEAPWKKPVNVEEALSFRIDKDELATGMGRIRNNLLQLFVANGDGRRRALIVDLDTPRFNAPVRPRLIPTHLNLDQQEAVRMAVAAQDYALILGMPGTGKTTVIAELLKLLVKSDLSILLSSYTHSAVDNILLKVKDAGLNILRLGSREKVRLVPLLLLLEDHRARGTERWCVTSDSTEPAPHDARPGRVSEFARGHRRQADAPEDRRHYSARYQRVRSLLSLCWILRGLTLSVPSRAARSSTNGVSTSVSSTKPPNSRSRPA